MADQYYPFLETELIKNLQSSLITWWQDSQQRKEERNFFWRKWILNPKKLIVELNDNSFPRDFGIFCVETVLQLTRAKNVNTHFPSFFKQFQSFKKIQFANKNEFIKNLTPLGRISQNTRNLKGRATIIVKKYNSKVPKTKDAIRSLMKTAKRKRHIYFVEAVSLYVHGIFGAPVDVNVERVYIRLFDIIRKNYGVQDDLEFCNFARKLVPSQNPIIYNLALLDLGALLCKPRNPRCNECPLNSICNYGKKYLE